MKKVITVIMVIVVLASLAMPSLAISGSKSVNNCPQGYSMSWGLYLYSDRSAASTSCYMHMTSAQTYARNSSTGQSASSSVVEAFYSITATASVAGPTQANGSHGAWVSSSSGCPGSSCNTSYYSSI